MSLSVQTSPNPKTNQQIQAALQHHQAGRLQEADDIYRQILTAIPNHPDALHLSGLVAHQSGKYERAVELISKAVGVNPASPRFHNNLGLALMARGNRDAAIASFSKAISLKPDLVESHSNLGNVFNELGRLDVASEHYRKALSYRADYAEAHYKLGTILTVMGQLEEAEASFRRVLQIKPNFIAAHEKLGATLNRMGRVDEALASYRESLAAKGDWKEALCRLTTPMLDYTGLVLDAPTATRSAETCKRSASPQQQVVHLAAPSAAKREPAAVKKLRIVLIYPPPWQILSPGESSRGMLIGPPVDKGDHDLSIDFQTITYGLLTIAAEAMRAGHVVSVHNLAHNPWREVEALIRENPAEIYGISGFTANRRGMSAVAALIRQHHPQAHITVGGPFVTALPELTLKYYRDIDTAVIGEGEDTFMELLEYVASGRPAIGIAGTAWRNGEDVVFGPDRPRIKELDALASPFDYFSGDTIMTSRGCPEKCTFCGSFTTWGKKLRFHSVESSLALFDKALARLSVPFLSVKDDTFTAHRRRTLEICDAIIERNMNFFWSCDTRVDSLDDEMLYKMRLAGCQMISLGIESGSPEILQNIRKKTTPDVMLEATRSARKYGIHVRYYMMLGNRGETPESIQQSVELIKAGRPSVYMFGPLAFYPGTEDWEFLRESDGVTPDIFFKNDFKELSISANRKKEVEHILLHIKCEVGAIEGYKYTVEEREEIVGRLPQLHCAHVELANAYLRAGRLDDAWSALDRAEELDFPIAGIIHNQRACIALARNDIGNALAFLERALQSHPHFIAKQNLMNLRTWVDAPQNNLGKPPKLNDSVLSIYFREILPEL